MRHKPDTCQLCDMFECVSNWGPPTGEPEQHSAIVYPAYRDWTLRIDGLGTVWLVTDDTPSTARLQLWDAI